MLSYVRRWVKLINLKSALRTKTFLSLDLGISKNILQIGASKLKFMHTLQVLGRIKVQSPSKTTFLLIIFGNKKRWNIRIVNGMQHFLGIGRASIYSVYSISEIEWNSLKSRESWNSGDRFRWTLGFLARGPSKIRQ